MQHMCMEKSSKVTWKKRSLITKKQNFTFHATVSAGDNLLEMSNHVVQVNRKNINLPSAELAQRVVKVKTFIFFSTYHACYGQIQQMTN